MSGWLRSWKSGVVLGVEPELISEGVNRMILFWHAAKKMLLQKSMPSSPCEISREGRDLLSAKMSWSSESSVCERSVLSIRCMPLGPVK